MAKAPTKTSKETTLSLPGKLQTVHVTRPKNVVTIVNDVDDIDVRDGSLLLYRGDGAGHFVSEARRQIGSGWGFTVVLTGQDGFSSDQARNFAATPQPFEFGVCAVASTDAHCTVTPSTVPKALDVLTPTGVLQSDELDYTKHSPVTIQDVVIP